MAASMAADYWLVASPLDADPYRRPHPWTSHAVGSLILARQQGLPGLCNYPEIPAHLHHSLGHATHVAVPNGHMGHLGTSLTQNDPQKTTELFSFGRPKEEKLKSHHHPQREATAPT
ncbi:hypothetical protein Taro_011278 [Colocasia esculenta]|uniref:Uncharacterized protein n=1 Tax=Colocasia esculenta TaxID=4460 RepID=A0A843U5P1_COLES|nr:hypothetical protein [Colocasia esculenta]